MAVVVMEAGVVLTVVVKEGLVVVEKEVATEAETSVEALAVEVMREAVARWARVAAQLAELVVVAMVAVAWAAEVKMDRAVG